MGLSMGSRDEAYRGKSLFYPVSGWRLGEAAPVYPSVGVKGEAR